MRDILFHSYHFPPIGGSGAQRPARMVKHLLEHGYRSTLVTSGGATDDRWAPEDRTLGADIPPGIAILRVDASEEPAATEPGWPGRITRLLGAPSQWARWWTSTSLALAREPARSCDVIYVWMQPYASATTGRALARDTGKPWVADLGDPWALDEMMVYPSALHRRRDLARMGSLLGTAAAIVMSTPEAVRRLLAEFPHLADRPVVAIPNGFAGEDFEGLPSPRAGPAFRIVHTGYLHTQLGLQHRSSLPLRRLLRGGVPGLDILSRSHVHLVDALGRLLEAEPSLRDEVELHLAGVLTDADREVAARIPMTKLHGYITHAESVDLMRTAHLLFLPMQDLPAGVRATIVPGKTYEYLASETPILGALPDGDARDILTAAGNAILTRPRDVDGIATAIREQIDAFRRGASPPKPRPEIVAQFEYRHLAGRLAAVFDEVLAR